MMTAWLCACLELNAPAGSRRGGAWASAAAARQLGSSLAAATWPARDGCGSVLYVRVAVALWLWPVAQGAKRSSGRAKVKF